MIATLSHALLLPPGHRQCAPRRVGTRSDPLPEKLEDAKAKQRVREQIEADKRARAEKVAREKALREGQPLPESQPPPMASPSAAAAGSSSSAPAAKGYTNTRLQVCDLPLKLFMRRRRLILGWGG